MTTATPLWPDGKRFAFTVFDDTDRATLDNVRPVYALLADLGFRTTKSVWIVRGDPKQGAGVAQTCEDPDYLAWLLELQSQGFEIGWHNATWHGVPRERVEAAMQTFTRLFGHPPRTAANHSDDEGMYAGDLRLSGVRRGLYNLLTCFRNYRRHYGHVEGDAFFWGDLCRRDIQYFRSFVYRDINALKACPFMPYHDPLKPYVNHWFASSDGHDAATFLRCIREDNQDRLEAEGGACIMYTHFADDFVRPNGEIEPEFRRLMSRLAKKNGWFAPVGALLDHLRERNGAHVVTPTERRRLERKWLWQKIFIGTN